jgi:hypothetical protein
MSSRERLAETRHCLGKAGLLSHAAAFTLLTLAINFPCSAWGQEARSVPIPPCPPSTIIASLHWAPKDEIVRQAPDGDNWPVTWAHDGALYTTWGDGTGFPPKTARKLSCGFAHIVGGASDFRGFNIPTPAEQLGQGRLGKKCWGILCVDRTLYVWFGHANLRGGASQLAWSHDEGRSWTFANWQFPEFGLMGFVNYGRDYGSARDDFVYAYSHDGPQADTPADRFVLMRARKDQLTKRDSWEFLKTLDPAGQPHWTLRIEDRGGIFRHADACLRSAMTYNEPLKRYLWWQQLPLPVGAEDRGDTRFSGGFGVYDAPEPWGPWTTAYFAPQWDTGPGEHGDFPAKWMSADGLTMHLVFSGDDCFSVRQAKVQLR